MATAWWSPGRPATSSALPREGRSAGESNQRSRRPPDKLEAQVCVMPRDPGYSSLQARLLEPHHLPWKAFFRTHFDHSPLPYGPRSLFLTKRTQDLGIQNRRATGYAASFRRLLPHRLVPPSSLTRDQVLREPLFYNAQVTENNLPLPATGVWQPMVLAGVTSVGHLLHSQPDLPAELLNRMQTALPVCWSALLWAPAPPPAGWYMDTRFSDRLLLARPDPALPSRPVWSSFTVLPDNSIQELSCCPALPPWPIPRALVVEWDSSRPWRPGHTPTVGLSSRLYFVGESTSFCPRSCSVGLWEEVVHPASGPGSSRPTHDPHRD